MVGSGCFGFVLGLSRPGEIVVGSGPVLPGK